MKQQPPRSKRKRQKKSRGDRHSIPRRAYTVDEIATACGSCRSHIYGEIGKGRLVARKIGASTRIVDEDFDDYLRRLPTFSRRTDPAPTTINTNAEGNPPMETAESASAPAEASITGATSDGEAQKKIKAKKTQHKNGSKKNPSETDD